MDAPEGDADLMRMMRMLMMQMSEIENALTQPKQITITRDKNGKITGAEIGTKSDTRKLT